MGRLGDLGLGHADLTAVFGCGCGWQVGGFLHLGWHSADRRAQSMDRPIMSTLGPVGGVDLGDRQRGQGPMVPAVCSAESGCLVLPNSDGH